MDNLKITQAYLVKSNDPTNWINGRELRLIKSGRYQGHRLFNDVTVFLRELQKIPALCSLWLQAFQGQLSLYAGSATMEGPINSSSQTTFVDLIKAKQNLREFKATLWEKRQTGKECLRVRDLCLSSISMMQIAEILSASGKQELAAFELRFVVSSGDAAPFLYGIINEQPRNSLHLCTNIELGRVSWATVETSFHQVRFAAESEIFPLFFQLRGLPG